MKKFDRKEFLQKLKHLKPIVWVNLGLTIAAIVCFVLAAAGTNRLESQKAAERWQGESETHFTQLSCYLPANQTITVNQVYDFRTAMIKAMQGAGLDTEGESTLWDDAWSCSGTAEVKSDHGSGKVSVTAVGGDFFGFHPLQLLSGSYIMSDDVMQDRVLLDEDTAWLLFGSDDVSGLSFELDGVPVVAAGVIQRETDKADTEAYTDGMGIYVSYDYWLSTHTTAGIAVYECVMAEPVDGFARSTAEASFPLNGGILVENTTRYSFTNLLSVIGSYGKRSMHTGALFPYWENAARYSEDWCALWMVLGMLLMAEPAVLLAYYLIRWIARKLTHLNKKVIPEMVETDAEVRRRIMRRRWQERHPDWRD